MKIQDDLSYSWGSFETVSWKGHNYQVKWWSTGDQPDTNCG
ncbi:hypothetical protein [Klebsiella oxytoca]